VLTREKENGTMTIQYKAVGARSLTDEGHGIVTALVSVTGIKDNVNDIIEPGAYAKSLSVRKPKGVWHHSWEKAIAKTLEVKELMPGDPNLPKTLADGTPWPAAAGALQVKMQFNLNTSRGRDAYEDVKFFGDDQEWSIGYNVPAGSATRKDGIRYIKGLDLYEYSPVLFGAMSNARTTSIKSAQEAFRELREEKGDDTESFLMEVKSFLGEDLDIKAKTVEDDNPDAEEDVEDQEDTDEDDFYAEYDDEDSRKSFFLSAAQAEHVEYAIKALQDILDSATDVPYESEGKDFAALAELAEALDLGDDVIEKSVQFDDAFDAGDVKSMETSANPVLDLLDMVDGEKAAQMADYIVKSFKEAGVDVEAQAAAESVEAKSSAPDVDSGADAVDAEAKSYVETVMGVKNDYELDYQFKRDFSPKKRDDLAKSGDAMPDGSFPIENETDLKNAIHAIGRAKNPSAVKAHIKKRAHALDCDNLVPDDWKSADAEETKDDAPLILTKDLLTQYAPIS
jgi:phage head maturation protease